MANKYRSAHDRFEDNIERTDSCWLWTGALTPEGYGQFSVDGRLTAPHRWAFRQWVGPVPDGLELDHLCRVRRCANPAHLEAVTHQENMRRAALAAGKDVACSNGHPRTSENVRVTRLGHQRCRACNRLHAQTPEQRAKRNARDRARRAQRAPAATLRATHADPTPVPRIPGTPEGAQGHSGPCEVCDQIARRRVRRHAQTDEQPDPAPAPVRDTEGPQNATERVGCPCGRTDEHGPHDD